jgi:hypothetical protein
MRRIFADLRGAEPGGPDGMKVDVAGNVYCGGAGGIYILDPKGKKLGRILHGCPETTNIAFGGDDWKTLYFTNWNSLVARAVGDHWKVDALEAPHVGERTQKELISAFVGRIADLNPQLVTFNGNGFDLPVLRYRRRPRPPRCTFVVQLGGASPLNEISRIMGMPGKPDGIDGG